MAVRQMPISPHLQIYKWTVPTMVASIGHRATGIVLYSGAVGLVYWLVALAFGPSAFSTAQWFFHLAIGQALVCLWSFAFFYHLLNGIRHLCFDSGIGFSIRASTRSGWLVVLGALAMTGAAWAFGWLILGGVI